LLFRFVQVSNGHLKQYIKECRAIKMAKRRVKQQADHPLKRPSPNLKKRHLERGLAMNTGSLVRDENGRSHFPSMKVACFPSMCALAGKKKSQMRALCGKSFLLAFTLAAAEQAKT
jgi:hypothetical protein